ncbi:MAG: hypothetical protein AB8B59_17050, partial [Maribacter sp.]
LIQLNKNNPSFKKFGISDAESKRMLDLYMKQRRENFKKVSRGTPNGPQGQKILRVISSTFNEGLTTKSSKSNPSGNCYMDNIKIDAKSSDFGLFGSSPDWILPGVIIEASSFLDGGNKAVSSARYPISISSNIVGSSAKVINDPSKFSQINNAISQIKSQSGTIAADISFSTREIHSVEELGFTLSGKYSNSLSGISARLDMNYGTKKESHYYMVDFTQKMFHVDVDLLNPALIFKDIKALNAEHLYVSRVTYGRRAIVVIKSKLDFSEFNLSVQANLDQFVHKGELKSSIKTLSNNTDFEIKALLYGGTPNGAIKSIEDMLDEQKPNLKKYLNDHPGDVRYALPIGYRLKNLNNENIGLYSVFNQKVKNCIATPAKNIRLRVTLTKVGNEQGRDNKGIGNGDNPDDYGIQQWVNYKVNGKFKQSNKSERKIKVNKPLLQAKENTSTWKNRQILILGDKSNQIHILEGDRKTINNSIVYEITPSEYADKRATFRIHTWLKEYTGSEDKIIANDEYIDLKIDEVLAYLLDPDNSRFGSSYFNKQVKDVNGLFHAYGTARDVMWLKKDVGNALAGNVFYRLKNSNMHMRTRFYLRFELIP